MPHDSYSQFVLAVFVGFGLVLAAAANLVMRRASVPLRGLTTALAAAVAVLACRAYHGNTTLIGPLAAFLGSGLLIALVLTTPLPERLARWFGRPRLAWKACLLLGVGIIAASTALYDEQDEAAITRDTDELETLEDLEFHLDPTMYRIEKNELTTDLGTPVETWTATRLRPVEERLRLEDAFFREAWNRDDVLRTGPADDRTNCFGWVFTGGRSMLPLTSAERILADNGYMEVKQPAPGDLVAYSKNGELIHVAIVRYVSESRPPLVEGKWAVHGTFLHPVQHSLYGREYAFLRSPRAGHLLKGLRDEEPPLEDRTE